jgi:hypothetical protein
MKHLFFIFTLALFFTACGKSSGGNSSSKIPLAIDPLFSVTSDGTNLKTFYTDGSVSESFPSIDAKREMRARRPVYWLNFTQYHMSNSNLYQFIETNIQTVGTCTYTLNGHSCSASNNVDWRFHMFSDGHYDQTTYIF